MPKHPWELAGWKERWDAVGPLEWEDERRRYRLATAEGRWLLLCSNGTRWIHYCYITDHEAACLIAARFDELLDEHGAFVRKSWDGKQWDAYKRNPDEVSRWKLIGRYPDPHTAQAAAVDAVLKEKEDAT